MSTGPFSHEVVLASAGSGKTHRLTSRYIALLRAGVGPSRVLATTFTRKAAGQILERVVERLLDAGPEAARPLADLLDDLERASVATIDAFFMKQASAQALELGVPPGWRIAEEGLDASLRRLATIRVLDDLPPRHAIELYRLIANRPLSIRILDDLVRALSDAHGVYLSSTPEAWRAYEPPASYALLDADARRALLAALAEAPLPVTKSGKPHASFVGAREIALDAARAEDWEALLKGALARNPLVSDEPAFSRVPYTPELVASLRPLASHGAGVLLARHAGHTRALHELLRLFDDAYRRAKADHGAYRFDDVPRLLSHLDGLSQDELAYRLDARYDHVLLDEFQDTSSTQFSLLAPLVEEILSGGQGLADDQPGAAAGRSVFCVGDSKQALYQWRDAQPELLASLAYRWPQLEPVELSTNWRSSPVVLRVVDRVFDSLRTGGALEAPLADAAIQWTSAYREHAPARAELPGRARVLACDEPLRRAAEIVRERLSEAPGAGVGVLLRRRAPIPGILDALARLGIDASEEGGNPLVDSPAVASIVSLLCLVDHPGDTLSHLHVLAGPLAPLLGLDDWDDRARTRRALSRVRRALGEDGLPATIQAWARGLSGRCTPRDAARLEQLVALAQQFTPRQGSRLREFVAHAMSHRVEAPGGSGVRVMTIHASKGLEFDAVVLPDLDQPLLGRPPQLIARRPSPEAPVSCVVRYPRQELAQLDPALAELQAHWQGQKLGEELCVLYVALTRARRSIDVLVQQRPPARSLAGIVCAALGAAPRATDAPPPSIEPIFECKGSGDWHEGLAARAHPRPEPAPIRVRVHAPRSELARAPTRTPTGIAGGHGLDASSLFDLDRRGADRGSLVHAWLADLEWLDDAPPDPPRLREIARREGLESSHDFDHEVRLFVAAISNPDVRALLSRAHYAGLSDVELRREEPFHVVDPQGGAFLAGRFDRLVLARAADATPQAHVIDFKTDALGDDAELARAVERHTPQMHAYARAARVMIGGRSGRVRTTLVFLSVAKLVEVPPQAS